MASKNVLHKKAKIKRILFRYAVRVNAKKEIGYDYFEIPVGFVQKMIEDLFSLTQNRKR